MRKGSGMMSGGRLLVLTLGCLCGLSACLIEPPRDTRPDAGSGSFESAGRLSFTATLLPEGEVLVVGGSEDQVSLSSVQLYNPKTRAWRTTGSLLEARSDHTSLLLQSGKVLVLGGTGKDPRTGQSKQLTSMELYDPVSGRWSSLSPMSQPRSDYQVTHLHDDRILVTGGYGNREALASVEAYDPKTDRWSARARMSQPRAQHLATRLQDGRVLVVGGPEFTKEPFSAEVYDPATNTWSNTASMNGRHPYATALARHDGQVLILRGESTVQGGERYDPARGTWTVVPFRTAGVLFDAFPTTTLLPDGRILFAAGSSLPNRESIVRYYHSETYEWSLGSPLPEPRSGHEAVLLANGKVLLVGGTRTTRPPAAPVATYDPSTDTWE